MSRSALAVALAVVLTATTVAPASGAPLEEVLMPMERYNTAKAKTLATTYRPQLVQFYDHIYYCIPWVDLQKNGIGFRTPRWAQDDARYLSVWIWIDQADDGQFSTLPVERRASADETNRVALEIEEIVRGMPHVEHLFTTAGGFLFGGSTSERAGRGSMTISLARASERDMSAEEWVQELEARIEERGFPGASVFVRPPRIQGLRTSTSGDPVEISIRGDDLGELQRLGEMVILAIEDIPGLENLEPSSEEASPQVNIELDRERAASLGLDVAEVGQTLRTALDGTIATRYTEGNREYDVRVMLPRERFTSPEDLLSVALFPPAFAGGTPVYLRDVATVETGLGPTSILREEQNRALRIEGDVLTEVASVGEVDDAIQERLANLELPDGYGIVIGGEAEAIRDNNRQLTIVALLAVFLVFVVLAVQYESLVNPFVILLAIPLSLVGVGFLIWATGTPLSAPVLLGVILLAGIVVNNAILLIEYAEQYRHAKGLSLAEAVVEAGAVRLRPILMTTSTTVLGLVPMALGLGEGGELQAPLARVIIGGLTTSTLITLVFIPVLYLILEERVSRTVPQESFLEPSVARP